VASACQRSPANSRQIALISELGIGDRDLAFEGAEPGFFVGIVGARDMFVEGPRYGAFVECRRRIR
jgi:hypothetical protein